MQISKHTTCEQVSIVVYMKSKADNQIVSRVMICPGAMVLQGRRVNSITGKALLAGRFTNSL